MSDLILYKQNEAKISVQCNATITKELRNYFSVKADNYRFHPLYKQGIWSGDLYFFDARDNTIGIGLKNELYKFAKLGKYTIESKFTNASKLEESEFRKFIDTLNLPTEINGNPFELRDYQFQAAFDACKHKILNIKSVTSSGKSLIIYIILRYFESLKMKSILITPSVSLVHQMFSDFESYGWEYVADKCHMIYAGQKKVFSCPVIISTYQSLYKDTSLFQHFDALLIDEVHGNSSEAKSLKKIAFGCVNASYRIGFSGTFPNEKTGDWLSIVGSTGPIVEYSTYKKLQEDGHIANLKIFSVILQYNKKVKLEAYEQCLKDYQEETDFVNNQESRMMFIAKMAQNVKKNTLILFTKKDKHGYPLHKMISDQVKDKRIIYIDGDTDAKEREKLRHEIEKEDNCIVLATYGVFSQGISIRNIHTLIFASGYRSKIKVIQSIGRALRKMKDKDSATLMDLVDDLSFIDRKKNIKFINYAMKHHKERTQIYADENFDVKTIKFNLQ
jgi:superfamily II DNA or RNA helicase